MLALGVDAGDDAIRLALLDTSGRSPRLVGTFSDRRVAGESLADALRAAIAAHCPTPPDAVASALAGKQTTFRLLRLPFGDQSRLAATVPFELEGLVPFDLENALTTFAAVERSPEGTTVLAAIAPRDAVQAHVAELQEAGVDPAIVDIGALATAGLLAGSGDLLVVEPRDDGGVALLRGGHLAALHVVDAGGGAANGALLRQTRWAILALAGNDPLPPIALVGPGAEEGRSLAGQLGASIAAPAQHVPAWASDIPLEHVRAAALAARAAGLTRLGINFRTGDLAYHAPNEEAHKQLRRTAILAGVVALLGLLSFGVAVGERRSELGELRSQIATSVHGVLPNAAPGSERIQLEAAVEALTKRRDALTGNVAGRPQTLDVLRSIAEAIPAQTPFEVQDLAVEPEGIRLHARTNSYESVDVVKRALQSVPGMKDAQVKEVKTGVDGRVEFRASLDFAPEGSS